MKAVILQPMYLPWMGYFGLIDQADVFVYYDDVQFTRRSWQRRNKIKVPGGDFTWLTVPVVKDFGQNINEVEIRDTDWRNKHWKSIQHSYASAPYFEEYKEEIREIYATKWQQLVDLDIAIIQKMCELIGIEGTTFLKSSELTAEGAKTDRLLSILNKIDADKYVSGPGAKDYLEVSKFEAQNIDVFWHHFDHPTYQQPHGEFVSHLSIVDSLFTTGADVKSLIQEGEKNALRKATKDS